MTSRPRTRNTRAETVGSSFWLVPSLFAAGSVVLAVGLSALELRLMVPVGGILPSGTAGARSLLSSIITAMISFTALVFSITVVALQLASSQYSPRILRTFLQDRVIQVALGTFVATFLFAMVVLAALPDSSPQRLPELSLAVAMALVLVSSAVFIYYLHHITTIMRVSHIIASIGAQSRQSIDRHLTSDDPAAPAVSDPGPVRQVVTCPDAGMVTDVDLELLARVAGQHRCVLAVVPAPGDFVVSGGPLVTVHDASAGERVRLAGFDDIAAAITLGPERTPGQDIGFGFRQLADIAERALSPGVNDITTAVRSLQESHDLLRRLLDRADTPRVRHDQAGQLRAVVRRQSYDSFLAVVIDDLRAAADALPRVRHLMTAILDDLAAVAPAHRRAAIDRRRERND